MKVKKKTAILVSFTLGMLLFAATALADITSKSGYEQLKDALKKTAGDCSDQFNNYTLEFSLAVKDNGKTLMTGNDVKKFDRDMGATESHSYNESIGEGKSSSLSYTDKNTSIYHDDGEDIYHVTEFTKGRNTNLNIFDDPFRDENAEDIEKIVDALVGSLKDYVVVTDEQNGSKEISGSLTEAQIPSLVNAVASFQFKQEFSGIYSNNREQIPRLTKDIFVKEVQGNAAVNKDGVMESILGTATLSGTDEQGQVHEISIEVLSKLSDINTTTVTKPDLTGKKVEKNIRNSDSDLGEISNPQKYVGQYRNDIVIEKDGKLVKAGERILDITQMDGEMVVGSYHEEYKQGFDESAAALKEFSFKARFNNDQNHDPFGAELIKESSNDMDGNIRFDPTRGKISFYFSRPSLNFDSEFNPVLE